jgi:hypothetical protein
MLDNDLHPERLLEAALVVGWLELAGGTAAIDTVGAVLLAFPAVDYEGHVAALQIEAAGLGREMLAVLTGRHLRHCKPQPLHE